MELLLSLLLATVPLVDGNLADGEVLGTVGTRIVRDGESLIEIAREHNVGFNAIAAANPGVDEFVPDEGTAVTIPNRFVVPRAAAPGVVAVNLSEMRLYYWPRGKPRGEIASFPVGVGMEGWHTPLGTFTVVGKTANPTWIPPASIRREDPELPARVPPGPDNPLGTHALRLSSGSIMIHGTDKPFGVGRKASHGCIRLYPEDIPRLFELVPVKTRVTIVREPVKVGLRGGRVYVEIHDDPDSDADVAKEATRLLAARGIADRVDQQRLQTALEQRRGIPVDVSIEAFF
ncbi:MAG TPA: L,D-transpeptidase family protein [Anaeromyxobacteraceae bacterium]|nr:L,D-transpeptidase family protein [Anaeromyxobacteraceae bacterium]